MTRVAQPQDLPGLHYLGVGTPTENPEAVWSHARWGRLAKGFTSQGAVLLLFLPPDAIPHMALTPDGMIILAPPGFERTASAFPGIQQWQAEGVSLLAVVPEPGTKRLSVPRAARPDPEPQPPPRPLALNPREWQPGTRRLAFGLLVVAGLVGAWTTTMRSGRGSDGETATPGVASTRPPPDTSAARPNATPASDATPTPAPPPLDSLYYSVQVAAFNTADRAMEYGASLERESLVAAVTPIRLGRGIWFRVILGALPTAHDADAALRALWRDGLVEAGHGTILRTPQAFDLGTRGSEDLAREEALRLRRQGIPAYIVKASLGTARVLVGAFETPEQTAVAESLITAAGLAATLITRTGIAP